MTDAQLVQDLIGDKEYLTCPAHMEDLCLVCLQKNCKNRLICGICQQEKYQGKKVTCLRTFLSQLKFDKETQHVKILLRANEHIKECLDKALQQINRMRQSCLKELQRVQISIQIYCNQLADKFIEQQRLRTKNYVSRMIDCYFQQCKVKELNSLIGQLRSKSQVSMQQAVSQYVSSTERKLNHVSNYLKNINFSLWTDMAVKQMGTIIQPMSKVGYKWSQHKAQKIVINEMTASQTLSGSNGERFALLDPESETELVNINFRIKKVQGWVGVGICLKNEIIKASYKFNYTKAFHGSYLVSANGYSWSHSDTNFNSKYKGFCFAAGDVVSVIYNPDDKQVQFENKKGTKFTLSVTPAPPGDVYVPCVNLCNPGDEVELIND